MSDPATEAALREMSRSIGGLESTVKTLVSTWQSQEMHASQGRRDLHQKFDALAEKVQVLASKVEAAIKDITEIKPSVDAFEQAKHQAQGAQTLGKWIWGGILFVGGGIGWVIANWVTITPKPPLPPMH
ncbi:MAG: DUF1515 family protein [Pseudomonadota bacterium]